MKYGSFLNTILLTLVTLPSFAGQYQELSGIKDLAKSYALSKFSNDNSNARRIDVSIGNIDPRLRLSNCSSNLMTFIPPGSRLQGNTTVGVRCDGIKPWSIYVPIKISVYEKAIVAVTKLTRGDIIGKNNIRLDEVDISYVRGKSFTNLEQIIGTKLKTSIKANQVIDSTTICLICKGDKVMISAKNSAISVTMAGVALNDGGRGDRIRVQNNSSRRIVEAIVSESGKVNVHFD